MSRLRLWLPLLALTAAAITALIILDARSRTAQNLEAFQAAQRLRISDAEVRVDDYFGKANQLAEAGAQTLGSLNGDPHTARGLALQLFRSRTTQQITGLGAFYARGVFDGLSRFSVYVRSAKGAPVATTAINGYLSSPWFARAKASPAFELSYYGPYQRADGNYITTIKSFHRAARFAGAVIVDTPTRVFAATNLRRALAPGDVAYIESSIRHGRVLLSTEPVPLGGHRIERVVGLRYSGAYLHLSSDAAPLQRFEERVYSTAIALGAAMWLFAFFLGASLLQTARTRERQQALENERTRLENEIAVRKSVEAELRKTAFIDELSGLPNRAAFLERASELLAQARQGRSYVVYLIDLDRFSLVNETLGHTTGDRFLKVISDRLRDRLGRDQWLARLRGDEFAVVAGPEVSSAGAFGDVLLSWLREPVLVEGYLRYSSASLGIVVVDDQFDAPEEILRDADIAVHAAKLRGRGSYAFFDAAMRRQIAADADMENDLRHAIEQRAFEAYYQPIVDLKSGAIVSFEALARWPRRQDGLVNAATFIGNAERWGLVDAIDSHIFERVCYESAQLLSAFDEATIAVNVSAAHLAAPDFAPGIERMLKRYGVRPERLKLEITETAIMHDAEQGRSSLQSLRNNGIHIVLDDFGAGHSSLAYIHRLPIAGIKIDGSFVAGLPDDANALAIIRSVVALADNLGLYTIAEGVETEAQLELVRQAGVMLGQGYLFSPPLPPAEAHDLQTPVRWRTAS